MPNHSICCQATSGYLTTSWSFRQALFPSVRGRGHVCSASRKGREGRRETGEKAGPAAPDKLDRDHLLWCGRKGAHAPKGIGIQTLRRLLSKRTSLSRECAALD